jgi:hypothetical protein
VSNIDTSMIMVQGDLAACGAQINQMAGSICDELQTLKNQLAPLGEAWAGAASSDYQSYQEMWNAAAYGLFGEDGSGGVLGAIAHAMNVVWANYSDAEWANVQTWQNG